jgi:hypothetical protein
VLAFNVTGSFVKTFLRGLKTVAKTDTDKIALTEWENTLCSVIRSRQPGIMIQSIEEKRALDSLIRVLQHMGQSGLGRRELLVWSQVTLRAINIAEADPKTGGCFTETVSPTEFFKQLKEFRENKGNKENPTAAVLVLCDAGHLLETKNNLRMLRETLSEIRGTSRTIVFMGTPFDIPPTVAPDINVQTFALPTAKDLQLVLAPVIDAYAKTPAFAKIKIDKDIVPKFARACAGLTEIEARGLLGLSVARFQAFDARAVDMALKEKAQVIKRSNVLEYRVCTGGLDKVGGLQNIKAWIRDQDHTLKSPDEARAAGMRMAKGLMLIGVPGTGKTLVATMLAAHWSLPLLVFDVGRAFGSLVGQSEANIDQVIMYANVCRPCIIFIDEIEKALGGGGGELDGGTTARVKGKLMTWLNDKPEDVFVVATANDVTKFESEPAFIRSGRFDLISFVDLPDFRSRLEILAIQYKNAVEYAKAGELGKCTLGDTIPSEALIDAATVSKGYSGAELEVVIQKALRLRFNHPTRPKTPTSKMLVDAVLSVKPLSVTMKEPIQHLREWVKQGRAVPAGATLEDDAADERDFKENGLPILLQDAPDAEE